jgi:hypothetical protein
MISISDMMKIIGSETKLNPLDSTQTLREDHKHLCSQVQ